MARYAYVGAYSPPDGHGNGITVFTVDQISGKLLKPVQTVESRSPAFFCMNRDHTRLYAVNELNEFKGQAGAVSAFSVDGKTGFLTLLNAVSAEGYQPCHISLDPSEKHVIIANYGTGNIVVFPLEKNGSLKSHSQLIQLSGSGPNELRQEGPHAHMVCFDRKGKTVLVPDLGQDKVHFYNYAGGKLTVDSKKVCEVKPGSGPRHVVEGPDSHFLYVINELNGTICAYSMEDTIDGKLKHLQTESAMPNGGISYVPDTSPGCGCAELTLHPNGKVLYGSIRGDDSIVICAVNGQNGLLTIVGHQKTLGECPRHFIINSNGNLLYALNQKSDNIATFQIESETGKLTPTGDVIKTPSPICIILA